MTTISLPDDIIYQRLRSFIIGVVAPDAPEVIRGPSNRVPMPKDPFICLTPGTMKKLSWPVKSYSDPTPTTGTRDYLQPTQYRVQVDCYGPASPQWAAMIATLFFSDYGVENLGPEVAPLYADEPQEMALINDEQQFEQRWTFNALVQYNPVISTPQQFADQLAIDKFIEVDSTFPAGA